jgi:hypothetical protein
MKAAARSAWTNADSLADSGMSQDILMSGLYSLDGNVTPQPPPRLSPVAALKHLIRDGLEGPPVGKYGGLKGLSLKSSKQRAYALASAVFPVQIGLPSANLSFQTGCG